ncbi:MAG: translation initiation factor IF-2 subunit beta [Methanophagales archaeon]|nr:translation initiation factor IF-2 subunit beta [Methanophagales archaeon]
MTNTKMKEYQYEYEELLDRALGQLSSTKSPESRFVIPEIKVFIEGKTTIFDNFDAICTYINRESEHVMKFMLNELGTAGKIEGNRAIFQGHFSKDEIARQIQRYMDEYVLCWECKKPDTHFMKMDRIWVLKCDACGAIRPIVKRKGGKIKK